MFICTSSYLIDKESFPESYFFWTALSPLTRELDSFLEIILQSESISAWAIQTFISQSNRR